MPKETGGDDHIPCGLTAANVRPPPIADTARLRFDRSATGGDDMLRRNRQLLMACAAAAAALGAAPCPVLAAPAPSLSPEAAVTAYCAAWSITDRAARDQALARVWAADGVYSDADTYATGVKGLSDAI